MPILSASSTPSPQVIQSRPQTLRQSVETGVRDFVSGAVGPVLDVVSNAKQLAGIATAKPLDFSPQMGDPWIGYKSLAVPGQLRITGELLPDGIVMTHCSTIDTVDYSPVPVSRLDNASIQLAVQMQVGTNAAGQKGLGFTDKAKMSRASKSAATVAGGELLAASSAIILTAEKGTKESTINDRLAALAKQREDAVDAEVVEKDLTKLYVGDMLPRVAELRFVVADMVQAGVDYTGDRLLYDRYTLLHFLYASFCRNPRDSGVSLDFTAKSGRTMASRITAKNIVGRLVKLESVGLRPYGVKVWLTTKFTAIEVPETDLIAVRVVVTEFEQSANSNLPDVPDVKPDSVLVPETSSITTPVDARPVVTSERLA